MAVNWRTEVTNKPFYDVTATYTDPDDPTKTVAASPSASAATNSKAFRAAILAASKSLTQSVPGEDYSRGGMVFVPFGTYDLAETLVINRRIVLQGAQGWGRASAGAAFPGTILRFPAGTAGIKVAYSATFSGDRGDFTVIRDIGVQGRPAGTPVATAHGIQIDARTAIQNSSVAGFDGNGISIIANQGTNNADGWQIQNCFVNEVKGNGLHVEGTTANAGVASAVSIVRAGLNQDDRWGFFDKSKTGNTYIGCQAQECGQLTTQNPNTNSGNYHSEDHADSGDLNRTIFFRCYSEGTRKSIFVRSSMVLGFANNSVVPPEGGQQITFGSGTGNLIQLLTKTALPGGAPARDAFIVTDTGVTRLGGPLDLYFREHTAGGTVSLNESYGLVAVNATAATTVQLPTITDTMLGRTYTIKKTAGASNVSVNAATGQSIDGASSVPLNVINEYVTVAAAKLGASFVWLVIAKG